MTWRDARSVKRKGIEPSCSSVRLVSTRTSLALAVMSYELPAAPQSGAYVAGFGEANSQRKSPLEGGLFQLTIVRPWGEAVSPTSPSG